MTYAERLRAYEEAKQKLILMRLNPIEYEEKLKELIERWKI